jgi:hypothetical protein
MPQIFKGNLLSKLDKIRAQIRQGAFGFIEAKDYERFACQMTDIRKYTRLVFD